MKGKWIIGMLFLLIYIGGNAQDVKNNKVSAAPAIASLESKSAYTKGAGNFFTSNITNRLTPALNLSASQQQEMNDALYNYFVAKGPYLPLRFNNKPAYTQQQSILYGQLVTKLAGFLSSDQLHKWDALKPANSAGPDILVQVFY